MPKTLKDVLADPKTYPDDLKYTAGDVETTLGELRTLSAAEQSRISKEAEKLQADQKQLEAAQRNLAENFSKLVESGLITVDKDGQFQVAEKQPPVGTSTTDTKGVDYERDTYVGPVMKEVKAVQKLLQDFTTAQKSLEKQLVGTRTLYENDRLRGEFNRFSDWPEGYDFNKAVSEAAQKGHKDEFGRLNVQRLHDELAKPLRFSQAELDAQINERADTVVRERLASLAPRPGIGTRTPAKAKAGSLDEAIAQAGSDPEILQGLQGIVPVQ